MERALHQVARQLSRRAKIRGFRPGKAPYALVARAVGEDRLYEEALRLLGPQVYKEALAESGISHLKDSLIPVCTTEGGSIEKRAAMAYASLVSGITLANAGLGVVHGLASPVGGFFPVPHGVGCGTLVGAATRINVAKLRRQGEEGYRALSKYARIGALIRGKDPREEDMDLCCDLLVETIDRWTERLRIPRLGQYGIRPSHLGKILEGGTSKNNPVKLNEEEIRGLLLTRL